MYCPNCGEKIDDDYNFCPHCRTPIQKAKEINNVISFPSNDDIAKGNIINIIMLVLSCLSCILAFISLNVWVNTASIILAVLSLIIFTFLKIKKEFLKYTMISLTINLCSIVTNILIIIYVFTIAINL